MNLRVWPSITLFLCIVNPSTGLEAQTNSNESATASEPGILWQCRQSKPDSFDSIPYSVTWLSSPSQSALFIEGSKKTVINRGPLEALLFQSQHPDYSFFQSEGNWQWIQDTLGSAKRGIVFSGDPHRSKLRFESLRMLDRSSAESSERTPSVVVSVREFREGILDIQINEQLWGAVTEDRRLRFKPRQCTRKALDANQSQKFRGTPTKRFDVFQIRSQRGIEGHGFLIRYESVKRKPKIIFVTDSHIPRGSKISQITAMTNETRRDPFSVESLHLLRDFIGDDIVFYELDPTSINSQYETFSLEAGIESYRNLWLLGRETFFGPFPFLAGGDSKRIRMLGPQGPGNSGAPIVDDSGRFVGIYQQYENSFGLESFVYKASALRKLLDSIYLTPTSDSGSYISDRLFWSLDGSRTFVRRGSDIAFQEISQPMSPTKNAGGGAADGGTDLNDQINELDSIPLDSIEIPNRFELPLSRIWKGGQPGDLSFLKGRLNAKKEFEGDEKFENYNRSAIEKFLEGKSWYEAIEAQQIYVPSKARDSTTLRARLYSIYDGRLTLEASELPIFWNQAGEIDEFLFEYLPNSKTDWLRHFNFKSDKAFGQWQKKVEDTDCLVSFRVNRSRKSLRISIWMPPTGGRKAHLWIVEN